MNKKMKVDYNRYNSAVMMLPHPEKAKLMVDLHKDGYSSGIGDLNQKL